jgi:hypothetical protein
LFCPLNFAAWNALERPNIDGLQLSSLDQSPNCPERNTPLLGHLSKAEGRSLDPHTAILFSLEFN